MAAVLGVVDGAFRSVVELAVSEDARSRYPSTVKALSVVSVR